jgi:hypothetical protein
MPTKPPALIAAPYAAPKCKIGGTLACRLRGDVPVDGITDAPIPWPYTRYRGAGVPRSPFPLLILCGDLERAVRTESATAIMYYWGVSGAPVVAYRKALGVGKTTVGSTRLRNARAREKLSDVTPKQVRQVRELIAAGKTLAETAAASGIKMRAMLRILRGETFVE